MSKKIIVGNWKMNLTVPDGVLLAKSLQEKLLKNSLTQVKVILGVPFTHITSIVENIEENIAISAQDCSAQKKGAFTGEVSATMVASAGAKYIIIGHSERREYHRENNNLLIKKINLALENELKVIYCCGEVLSERKKNKQFEVVKNQLSESLFHLTKEEMKQVILAYEPVWAIGTGVTATSKQVQEMHSFIRKLLQKKYGNITAKNTSILYGGSCKPTNAKELFSQLDVDGGLIGGASLKINDFLAIINSF